MGNIWEIYGTQSFIYQVKFQGGSSSFFVAILWGYPYDLGNFHIVMSETGLMITKNMTIYWLLPIGSMYGIYANIWGILMVNVTIYGIHGSYGLWIGLMNIWIPNEGKAPRRRGSRRGDLCWQMLLPMGCELSTLFFVTLEVPMFLARCYK